MQKAAYGPGTKRATDVALAVVILVVTSPILLAAMTAILLTMGRPVFFVQERTGRFGERYRLLKLRTMRNARDRNGELLPDSARISPVGQFLRKSSIDELPELLNVVRGDMSLVGPRPLLPRYDSWYSEREALRFTVRPGITGLAQVNGRNDASWDARLEMDVRYVMEWSYRLDLKIMALTIAHTLFARGVVVDPASAMLDLDVERQYRP